MQTHADAQLEQTLHLRAMLPEGATVYAVQYGTGAVSLYTHKRDRELIDITATVAEVTGLPTRGGRLAPATAPTPNGETMLLIERLSEYLHGSQYSLTPVRL